jgi:hypothetical protein
MHVNGATSERYRSRSIALTDGEILIGNVIDETPTYVILLSTEPQSRGEIITVQLSDIMKGADGKPEFKDVGLPPGLPEIVESLTPKEIEALVLLLKTLN